MTDVWWRSLPGSGTAHLGRRRGAEVRNAPRPEVRVGHVAGHIAGRHIAGHVADLRRSGAASEGRFL